MLQRAYSVLTVKAVEDDGDERVITGTATTPTPDRIGDVVEPMGVSFKNPLPLLWQHRSDKPVGQVRFDKPTESGITFTARLPKIAEPGTLKDRVDEAWQSVKAGLVRAVSIGFRSIEHSVMENGGFRFLESEVLELSLVTIPANAEATIQTIKSIDDDLRAAAGREEECVTAAQQPPASREKTRKPVTLGRAHNMGKPISEQIAALEAERAAKAARMEEILQKSADEGRSTDEAEQEEFDGLTSEIEAIDADLKRFRALEKAKAATARPVEQVRTVEGAAQSRAGVQIKKRENLAPGIAFARLARVKALAKLDGESARTVAKEIYGEDSPVYGVLTKAAVAAGHTGSGGWTENLVGDETSVFADFVEFLRPMTILGKFGADGVPALRRVPFRTPLISQTGGGDGYWVGEGKGKPLTSLNFSRTTLDELKVANIAVVTEETLRKSSPSAEMILRDSLAAALRERLDTDFIDPTKTASAGVSPASITNGITPTVASGTDADAVRDDIRALFNAFIVANNPPTTGVFIMSAQMALSLSMMQNALGQSEFPGINMNGGTFFGLPVITSEYVEANSNGSFVYLVNAGDVYLADEGGIMVDMSREASLEMSDGPSIDATTGTGAQMVSLWQTNSVGFRAERIINWARRRSSGVAALSSVNWAP